MRSTNARQTASAAGYAQRIRPETLVLVGIAALWGLSVPVLRIATEHAPPSAFLALRFVIACAATLFLARRTLLNRARWSRIGKRTVGIALLAGVADFAGYAGQTVAVGMTSVANAAFLGALAIVFVPLLTRGARASRSALPMLCALAGLACLLGQTATASVSPGDLWALASAAAFALQIALLGQLPADGDVFALTALQMLSGAGASGAVLLIDRPVWSITALPADVWLAAVFTGVVATALPVLGQTWAQRRVSASDASLILCSEPAWGAAAGLLLFGEQLTALGALGCALILFGMSWPGLLARQSAKPWQAAASADLQQ
jgi:drug/metabolite transporter (DMT)-like permease